MKKLFIYIFLLFSLSAQAQNWTAAIPHNVTISGAPSQSGSRLRFNLTTGRIWEWNPNILDWVVLAQGIDPILGCADPAYTPTYQQSLFVINQCSPPELFHYNGATWELVGGASGGGTWGTITGTLSDQTDLQAALDAKLSSEVDGSITNELQNLSLSGQSLGISGGTGVTLPIVGVSGGTGISVSTTAGISTITNSSPSLWTDAGAFTRLTASGDRVLIGNTTELNTAFRFQSNGGGLFRGAGSTSATYGLRVENSGGTGYFYARNDGRVGILNSAPAYALDIVGDIGQDQPSALYNGSTKMVYGKPANHNYYFGGAGNVTGNATKNIAIGTSALLNLGATGGFNVAIGFEAGKLITTGQGNVAIGDEAMKTNTIGNNNFALGKDALRLSTADKNVAVGGLCMAQTTTGEKNLGLGYFALNGNTTGFENVAIGNVALQLNSDGYRNIGIGSEAVLSNVSGFGNIGIGNSSLYSTTGSRNTVVGYQSGVFLTTGSQNIIIGASLRPINDAGSNQMTIGNIIYATGVDGTGTTVSSGSVGIKTNAPSQDFHVVGNARITGAFYDSNNDPGTSGQVFSSTATGTDWVAPSTLLPYKVYSATITQSGTSAPVSVVMQNTLGVTPTWTRTGIGTYVLTATGAFVTAKTTLPNSSTILAGDDSDEYASTYWERTSADALTLRIVKNTLDTILEMNNTTEGIFIEIRVYN